MGDDFNVPPHVPANFAATMGLFHELLIVALIVLGAIICQHVGRDYLGIIFQETEGAAQSHAVEG